LGIMSCGSRLRRIRSCGKWINFFGTLAVIATFAVADLAVDGKALALGAQAPLARAARARALHSELRQLLEDYARAQTPAQQTVVAKPRYTFEPTTGKFTFDSYVIWNRLKIVGGEIRLYSKRTRRALLGGGAFVLCYFVGHGLKACALHVWDPSSTARAGTAPGGSNAQVSTPPVNGVSFGETAFPFSSPSVP
jgi:hypothetical protein